MALQPTSLREQRDALAMYLEYLPVLELRKQQLERGARAIELELERVAGAFEDHLESVRPWWGLAAVELDRLGDRLEAPTVRTGPVTVAGVTVPGLLGVDFPNVSFSLVGTAPVLDAALAWRERALTLTAQRDVLTRQRERIESERVRTTQRINLYEQVLIPETRARIRRIRRHLGDQLTAAVCRAKIAKSKLLARERRKGESHGRR